MNIKTNILEKTYTQDIILKILQHHVLIFGILKKKVIIIKNQDFPLVPDTLLKLYGKAVKNSDVEFIVILKIIVMLLVIITLLVI